MTVIRSSAEMKIQTFVLSVPGTSMNSFFPQGMFLLTYGTNGQCIIFIEMAASPLASLILVASATATTEAR